MSIVGFVILDTPSSSSTAFEMWEWDLAKEMQSVISNRKYLTLSRPPGFLPSGWTTYPLLLGEHENSGHLLEPTALNDWTGLGLRVRKWKAKSEPPLLHGLNRTPSSIFAVNLTENELSQSNGVEVCGCPEHLVSEISSLSLKISPSCYIIHLTAVWEFNSGVLIYLFMLLF